MITTALSRNEGTAPPASDNTSNGHAPAGENGSALANGKPALENGHAPQNGHAAQNARAVENGHAVRNGYATDNAQAKRNRKKVKREKRRMARSASSSRSSLPAAQRGGRAASGSRRLLLGASRHTDRSVRCANRRRPGAAANDRPPVLSLCRQPGYSRLARSPYRRNRGRRSVRARARVHQSGGECLSASVPRRQSARHADGVRVVRCRPARSTARSQEQPHDLFD